MSSHHHVQSLSDPNYLLRLQNLQIADDAQSTASTSSLYRANSLNGKSENGSSASLGRNPIATATKYNYMKAQDNSLAAQAQQLIHAQNLKHNFNGSPTHSQIALHAQTNSNVGLQPNLGVGYIAPVYENLDYGKTTTTTAASNQYISSGGGTYEIIGVKNEPKLSHGGSGMRRFTHTPQPPDLVEATPIYENLNHAPGNHRSQSSSGDSPPQLPPKKLQYHHQNDTSGMYVQPQTILSQLQRCNQSLSSPVHQSPTPRSVQYSGIIHDNNQAVAYALHPAMSPNYLEEINGSDYVCMTRATPQSASKLAPLNMIPSPTYTPMISVSVPSTTATSPSRATSFSVSTSSNLPSYSIGAETPLTSKNLRAFQQEQSTTGVNPSPSVSPALSQMSNSSNKRKI